MKRFYIGSVALLSAVSLQNAQIADSEPNEKFMPSNNTVSIAESTESRFIPDVNGTGHVLIPPAIKGGYTASLIPPAKKGEFPGKFLGNK